MTGTIFFDSGPIISLTISRLSWILPELKKHFDGHFYITPAVHYELIERPLQIRRFQFEALQVMKLVRDGVLKVYTNIPQRRIKELTLLVNTTVSLNNKTLDIMQEGEMQSLACVLENPDSTLALDERTLRTLVEDQSSLITLLTHRFKGQLTPNHARLKSCQQTFKDIKIIRSTELVLVAYTLGLLKDYIPPQQDGESFLLRSALWAVKNSGCAISGEEIEQLITETIKRSRT